MAQLLQINPSVSSIGANELLAGAPAASNGQFRAQPTVFPGSAAQLKKLPQDNTPQHESGILDNLPIGHPLTIAYVSTCQQDNSMIYVSPQIATLGFTPEAWLGKPDLRLQQVYQDDLARVEKALRDTIRTAAKFSCCYRLYDSAGNVHWFHDEASVVCDESGAQLFIMGAMRDITEIKVMEAELNEHRYCLERKVEQRTEQLMRRISLLESCNAILSDKLAHAKRNVAELDKQLAGIMSDTNLEDCHGLLTGLGDGAQKMAERSVKDTLMGCIAE